MSQPASQCFMIRLLSQSRSLKIMDDTVSVAYYRRANNLTHEDNDTRNRGAILTPFCQTAPIMDEN